MRKIELFQVGQTEITDGYTVYSAGVYFKKMSLSLADRALSPIETILGGTWEDSLSIEPVSITGASFEDIQLSEVESVADLYLQDGSFYFDEPNQDLYIAIFDYRNFIINDTISVGQTLGFINQAQLVNINDLLYPLETMVGSVNYEPRLNDVSINDQVSDQKNGLFVYGNLEASIKNNDGEYDFISDSITGNQAILLVANISDSKEEEIETGFPYKDAATAEDFKVVRKGVVQTVDYSDPDNPNIRAIDVRANWTQTIGENFLTVAEFPNLPDKFINDRKTIAIGPINGVQAVPLRDNATAASFDYFICDTSIGTIQSVSDVYFKGQLGSGDVDRFLTITTEYTINLTTGIITILNCVKGDVHVYGVFTTLNETVEIILFLLDTYDNLAYIPSNFNIDEVEEIRALDYTTHVYITGKGNTLQKVVQKLCTDIQIDFFQQGEVLSMRESNKIRPTVEEVPNYQIRDNPPTWNNNRTDTIKTVSVNYNYDYRTKLSETYYNDDLLQEAIDNNRYAIDKPFDVNLDNASDVGNIYDLYYNRFIDVPRMVTIRRTIPFTARTTDFITFPVIRKSLQSEKEAYQEELKKTIPTGALKLITTGAQKLAILNRVRGIPVETEKTIFVNAVYKITDYNEIDNTVDCVYFKDEPDRGVILIWSATPDIIFEWTADDNKIILEGNP